MLSRENIRINNCFKIVMMSRVVIRGLRKQLELGTPQQPIHEVVQT
jgi:hypothetical protein